MRSAVCPSHAVDLGVVRPCPEGAKKQLNGVE